MAQIHCKMCGGLVELPEGTTVGDCPYCGSRTTFPKVDSEKREQLYARAEQFRADGRFDRAISVYEEILRDDADDAEAYWGLLLSRFGIEYVEDPQTHERIPT
ncbi:MAG: tetratricopeptide repeat protein, partial [Victivallales bacterium]|nr:tetratricopeptide repeat protein [Victivallales bacterium]